MTEVSMRKNLYNCIKAAITEECTCCKNYMKVVHLENIGRMQHLNHNGCIQSSVDASHMQIQRRWTNYMRKLHHISTFSAALWIPTAKANCQARSLSYQPIMQIRTSNCIVFIRQRSETYKTPTLILYLHIYGRR